ncbi:GNAT family N-acetyltransferase [Lutibacter sp. A80]|uniref:GNAT family N-acetyltransferase n=1 Tax=Lutibacter sp. A80 TaxID=2918453 RepID=UPI001F05407C|nr:GNAT family N-acetyltransferase [Lutibacter sp. A80]UMB61609.1 GNAT family N-acetyltransferase [Lutibacter sp. A80]
MKIRRAIEKDVPEIIKIISDDKLGEKREHFTNPLPKSYLEAFKIIAADNNQELMVVEDENSEIIGTFQLSFIQYLNYCGGLRAQIEVVQVRKDKRGLGIGKQIFQWAIERSKEKNAIILQLTSDKKRPKAIKFYESLGFKASHEGMKLHF